MVRDVGAEDAGNGDEDAVQPVRGQRSSWARTVLSTLSTLSMLSMLSMLSTPNTTQPPPDMHACFARRCSQ